MKYGVLSMIALIILGGIAFLTIPTHAKAPAIHGVMENHAVYHALETEAFTFEVAFSHADSIYAYDAAMVSHHLVGADGSNPLTLELKDAVSHVLEADERLMTLTYTMPFEAAQAHITYDPAYLRIRYKNGASAHIPIGTFSYLYAEKASTDKLLDYERINLLSEDTLHGVSATGVCMDFKPLSADPVIITEIEPGSLGLNANMDYLTVYDGPITPLIPIETVIEERFNPKASSKAPQTHRLNPYEATTLCVPFQRSNPHPSLAMPFTVHYTVAGKEETLIIDDFRYIRNRVTPEAFFKEAARATLEEN